MASNGVTLPVFNVFRMFSRMGAERIAATSDGAVDLDALIASGVREKPDVAALASRDARKVTVMAWHYHDDDVAGPDAAVTLAIDGLGVKNGTAKLTHYRIDAAHSNAYTVWQTMDSPAAPTAAQVAQLEAAGQLGRLEGAPATIDVKDGRASLPITLPRQAVSLVVVEW
jgi:xylan 1,4-beta-xylosidase